MRKQAGGPCEKLNFPLVELEPYARVNRETTKLNKAHVRRDYSGRSICRKLSHFIILLPCSH